MSSNTANIQFKNSAFYEDLESNKNQNLTESFLGFEDIPETNLQERTKNNTCTIDNYSF